MDDLCDKMIAAEGIIFGTPIYFYTMAAQAKIIMNRTMPLNQPGRSLVNKVGGVVVDCGSLGLVDALKDLYFYIVARHMLPANFVAAYVDLQAKELARMEHCRKAAFDLGRQMVRLAAMKSNIPKISGPRHSLRNPYEVGELKPYPLCEGTIWWKPRSPRQGPPT